MEEQKILHSIQFARVGPTAIVYQTEHVSDERIRFLVARDVDTYGHVEPDAEITRFNQCRKCNEWTMNGDRLRVTINCPEVLKGLEHAERANASDPGTEGTAVHAGMGTAERHSDAHDGRQGADQRRTQLDEEQGRGAVHEGQGLQAPVRTMPTQQSSGAVEFTMLRGATPIDVMQQIAILAERFPNHRVYASATDDTGVVLQLIPQEMFQ